MDVDQREAARAAGLAALEAIATKRVKAAREIQTALAHAGAVRRAWHAEWREEQAALGKALFDLGLLSGKKTASSDPWEQGCQALGALIDQWIGQVLCSHGLDLVHNHPAVPDTRWATAFEAQVIRAFEQLRRAFDDPPPASAAQHWTFEEMVSGRRGGGAARVQEIRDARIRAGFSGVDVGDAPPAQARAAPPRAFESPYGAASGIVCDELDHAGRPTGRRQGGLYRLQEEREDGDITE